jgi:hypothetical protein
VHALRNIHRVLAPDGILVDTQPVSARPPVAASHVLLGTLDMREWAQTIQAVDERIVSAVHSGLYGLRHESRFVVTDTYDSGDEFLEVVRGWAGTRVPSALGHQVAEATPPITLRQDVRLRLFAARASLRPFYAPETAA